jgi:lysophospholipid acyltransferase (LPLAT)-like uncharacterized protein
MRAQPGVAALSAASRAPVLPLALSTRGGRLLRSWDRFLAPRPFDRGALVYAAPLPPPASDAPEEIEAHRLAVETAINTATARADELVGRSPVAPADPAP